MRLKPEPFQDAEMKPASMSPQYHAETNPISWTSPVDKSRSDPLDVIRGVLLSAYIYHLPTALHPIRDL